MINLKLSVIIPIYNNEEFISACVSSIINQTYKDIEIILVDDGSTDNTPKICEALAQQYSNILFIKQKNCGVSVARNAGIIKSTGDLITFVDSDDTIDSDMYEVLINALEKDNLDIVHCSYKRIENDKVTLVGNNTGEIMIFDRVEALECLLSGRLFNGSPCNKIYTRKIIEGIAFDEKLRINEDIKFNVIAFDKAKKTGYIDVCKYNYIIRFETSATNTTISEVKARDCLKVNKFIYDTIDDKQLRELVVNRYVNMICYYYRSIASKTEKKRAKNILKPFRKQKLYNNNKISVLLILYFSPIYNVIYKIYDKYRTPNWDVK